MYTPEYAMEGDIRSQTYGTGTVGFDPNHALVSVDRRCSGHGKGVPRNTVLRAAKSRIGVYWSLIS